MIKFYVLILFAISVSPTVAGDRCFCTPHQHQRPQSYYDDEETLNIINRQLSISPLKHAPKNDPLVEKVLKDQWAMLTSAVPIQAAPQPLRQFQFKKNWPVTPAQPVRSRNTQAVQTQTTTQVLIGVVRQNIVIDGGVTTSNVPSALLHDLAHP